MDNLQTSVLSAAIAGVAVVAYYKHKHANDPTADQLQAVSDSLAEQQTINEQLRNDIAVVTSEKGQLEEDASRYRNETDATLQQLRTEISNLSTENTNKDDEIATKSATIQQLDEDLAATTSALDAAESSLEEQKNMVATLQTQVSDLSTVISNNESNIQNLQEHLQTSLSENESLVNQVATLSAKTDMLTEYVKNGSDEFVTDPVPNVVFDKLHSPDVTVKRAFDSNNIDAIERLGDQSTKLNSDKIYIESVHTDEAYDFKVGRVGDDRSISDVTQASEDDLFFNDYGVGDPYLNTTTIEPIRVEYRPTYGAPIAVERDYKSMSQCRMYVNNQEVDVPAYTLMDKTLEGSSVKVRNVPIDTAIATLDALAIKEYIENGYHQTIYRFNKDEGMYKFDVIPGSSDKVMQFVVRRFYYSTDHFQQSPDKTVFDITRYVIKVTGALRYGLNNGAR